MSALTKATADVLGADEQFGAVLAEIKGVPSQPLQEIRLLMSKGEGHSLRDTQALPVLVCLDRGRQPCF